MAEGDKTQNGDFDTLDCRHSNSEACARSTMTEPGQAKATPSEQASKTFNVAFTKAPFFRTIQADGSWGRISPSGMIHLSFFNDCHPLPVIAKHNIEQDGKLSEEMNLVGPVTANKEEVNMVRQIELDVVLSLEVAKIVRTNLDNFIKILESATKPSQP